jgi:hypothetical protein
METNSMDASANTSDSEATQEEDRSLGAREFGVSRDNNEMTSALCGETVLIASEKNLHCDLLSLLAWLSSAEYHSAFRMGDVS